MRRKAIGKLLQNHLKTGSNKRQIRTLDHDAIQQQKGMNQAKANRPRTRSLQLEARIKNPGKSMARS
jgi:hypothetical protein